MENDNSQPMPFDRVRFINTTLACEAFSSSYAIRAKEAAWDGLITYSDGRNEYFEIQAKTKEECANELRRRGIL